MGALRGTAVPVPAVLATARAGEVFDVPFYVMSFAAGPGGHGRDAARRWPARGPAARSARP